jgi:hypothetical protein
MTTISRWKSLLLACAIALYVTSAHADSLNQLLFGRPTPPTETGVPDILRAPARWPDPPALPAAPAQPQIVPEFPEPASPDTVTEYLMKDPSKAKRLAELLKLLEAFGAMGRPPNTPPPTVGIAFDRGGVLLDYVRRYSAQGRPVEIRGVCASACTLVVSYIPKEQICFGDYGELSFHKARYAVTNTESIEATARMMMSYPLEIQDWIMSRGGIKKMPGAPWNVFWTLKAPELWKMGYRKCET